jgi:hypothetical protein
MRAVSMETIFKPCIRHGKSFRKGHWFDWGVWRLVFNGKLTFVLSSLQRLLISFIYGLTRRIKCTSAFIHVTLMTRGEFLLTVVFLVLGGECRIV